MRTIRLLAGLALSAVSGIGHGVARGWHAVRHPQDWYEEINQVYGRTEGASATKSAGTAGLGGHISGGGG